MLLLKLLRTARKFRLSAKHRQTRTSGPPRVVMGARVAFVAAMRGALRRLARQTLSSARGFGSESYASALASGETAAPMIPSQAATGVIDVRCRDLSAVICPT